MWTSSAIPYISLFCHQQTHTVILIFFSCTMHYTFQCLFLHCTFHVSCSLITIKSKCCWSNESYFVWSSKIFFCSFQLFENSHIHNVASTLINVMKLYVENNSIVSTLSNVANINVERDKVDLTLFNIVNFNVDIRKVISTLIWHCSTWRCHIALTTTLRLPWKVSWVSTNVMKRLHSLSNWKHIHVAEYLLIAVFVSFRKGIEKTILV